MQKEDHAPSDAKYVDDGCFSMRQACQPSCTQLHTVRLNKPWSVGAHMTAADVQISATLSERAIQRVGIVNGRDWLAPQNPTEPTCTNAIQITEILVRFCCLQPARDIMLQTAESHSGFRTSSSPIHTV